MLCLMEGHDMLGFIEGIRPETETKKHQWWRRSDALTQGWILGSLSEDVLTTTINFKTAKDIWLHLEKSYGSSLPSQSGSIPELKKETMRSTPPHWNSMPVLPDRSVSQQIDLKGDSLTPAVERSFNGRFGKSLVLERAVSPEEGLTEILPTILPLDLAQNTTDSLHEPMTYLPLYKAALRGDWDAAQEFIDEDEEACTANINKYGFTALHIAIGTGKQGINFVEKLVEKLPPNSLLEMLTSSAKYTPLHIAAVVGNIEAVKILVNKNQGLLYVKDVDGLLPIHRALINSHKDTFLYLLVVTKDNEYPFTFTGYMGVTLLSNVIFAGYFDIALGLVTRYPELARTLPNDDVDAPLMAIARKADAFKSGCPLNFFDSLIYKRKVLF
uniref:Putative ankyrin repeat-containing domain, Gag-polypeptide of LTR copia-type n=1 Tax=Helianthus annuus TaxID=4232 RepID=A0A251TFK3_HELAN